MSRTFLPNFSLGLKLYKVKEVYGLLPSLDWKEFQTSRGFKYFLIFFVNAYRRIQQRKHLNIFQESFVSSHFHCEISIYRNGMKVVRKCCNSTWLKNLALILLLSIRAQDPIIPQTEHQVFHSIKNSNFPQMYSSIINRLGRKAN